jgi:hypothetical protein
MQITVVGPWGAVWIGMALLTSTVALGQDADSGATTAKAVIEEVQGYLEAIEARYDEIAIELARLMPVAMQVEPALAEVGEEVIIRLEVLAEKEPNAVLSLHRCHFTTHMGQKEDVALTWQVQGKRYGLTAYSAEYRFTPAACGNYLVHWIHSPDADIAEYYRSFAVIDSSYAVCLFESTSHREPLPYPDFHRLHIPFDYWEHRALLLPELTKNPAEYWASISSAYRQYGDQPLPMLFADYFLETRDKESRFAQEAEELQRTALAAYQRVWPLLGFGDSLHSFAAYSIGNKPIRVARSLGYRMIGALCSGQNWQDGSFKINHSGMPDRPYFISREDFRKSGDGGPGGVVGVPQCIRNTFLNHDYNCTYCLEPAWNEFTNQGGGRKELDHLHMSRQYDFFEAMLQNRLNHQTPYFFTVGIEFNGVAPGITESNRLFLEYAAQKAADMPLVFSTGPAVTAYFRRHYKATPETVCYQQDYFGGLTNLGKPPSYPDTLEIEGPQFKSLIKAPDTLPYYHYDYGETWDYPDWGNESLPRNDNGYLTPGTYDRFAATPKIVDTRRLKVERKDSEEEGGALLIRVMVEAAAPQQNMVLMLWDIPRAWQQGSGWWQVDGKARLIPVRAPYTGNLNGALVAHIKEGGNTFTLRISTPERALRRTTVMLGDLVEGRVFQRDGQVIAYLWPTNDKGALLHVDPPKDKDVAVYMAPEGEKQPCSPGGNAFQLQPRGWLRLVGLAVDEIETFCSAEPLPAQTS